MEDIVNQDIFSFDDFIKSYRTIYDADFKILSQNLKDTFSKMKNIQDWMKEHLIANNQRKLHFVHSIDDETNVQKNAQKIRNSLDLKIDWYTNSKDSWDSFKKIRQKLLRVGIITMMNGVVGQNNHRRLLIEEFRAFTLADEYAPLIFINSNDAYEERLFSLVYEAVHVLFQLNDFFNDKKMGTHDLKKEDIKCYDVCTEILVPNEIFVRKWLNIEDKSTHDKISELATKFKCSDIVICKKAKENKYIEYEFFREFVLSKYNSDGKRRKNIGGNYYNILMSRYDNKFLLALDDGVNEGKISFNDVYKYTNINEEHFLKLMNKIKED